VYIDDLVIVGKNAKLVEIKEALAQMLEMKT